MIVLQDLIDRFGEEEIINISDHKRSQVIDEVVVNQAIKDALGEVESKLNSTGLVFRDDGGVLGYRVDGVVMPTPDGLILKACDIARYYLYENGVTKIVQDRYDYAIKWLNEVKDDPAMLTGKKDDGNADNHTKTGIVVMPNEVPSMWR
ncbi:DUF1320 domain-containing protein [Moraxella equi]|uniref:Mu-like prophage protein gp36 n=1 Tax=Moraxella equi TaxID=60442 RepID=A0A378QT81_9GAMM|nr:DUF1320 domain-containing protein [Moraxella equi]OPH33251.1 hypothetical protein B5J93_13075 [Moraxella equi]STZ03630.1 Mu-like prophage protein gp36 [Moraxella equi]